MIFLKELMPDILISSGGTLVKKGGEYIYTAEFSKDATSKMNRNCKSGMWTRW